jgi:hypothetical protein
MTTKLKLDAQTPAHEALTALFKVPADERVTGDS